MDSWGVVPETLINQEDIEMNIEQIEALEELLKEEKERIELEERERYDKGPCRKFSLGDWVTNGNNIGVVQRIWDNPRYINVDIKNNSLGIVTQTRSIDYDYLDDIGVNYYTCKHSITLSITGEEIEDLLYKLGHKNVNPADSKDMLRKTLRGLSRTHNP